MDADMATNHKRRTLSLMYPACICLFAPNFHPDYLRSSLHQFVEKNESKRVEFKHTSSLSVCVNTGTMIKGGPDRGSQIGG